MRRVRMTTPYVVGHSFRCCGAKATEDRSQKVRRPPRETMARLDALMRAHPQLLAMHRELTLAIASGCAKDAADVAETLAAAVARHNAAMDSLSAEVGPSTSQLPQDALSGSYPPCTDETLSHSLQKIADLADSDSAPIAAASSGPQASTIPDSSTALTITILETSFELADENTDALAGGASCDNIAHSPEAVLDKYLTEEAQRWKRQKHVIAKIVLDVARRVGLTPRRVHYEDSREHQSSSTGALNPLRHANVIVRADVSSAQAGVDVKKECEAELDELVASMARRGAPPLSDEDKRIALAEMEVARATLRYSVGLLRDLQVALDADGGSPPLSEIFQKELIRALNPRSSDGLELDEESRAALAAPVIPFNFMLKACLWYDPEIVGKVA